MTPLPDYIARGANAANELRLRFDLGLEPISDLWGLIREIEDATLAFHGFGSDGPDGVYYWGGGIGLIVVNSEKEPLARQRFTAAHELGHHMFHREGDESLVIADGDLQARSDEKPIEEKEADAFASYLLAPPEAMKRAFRGKAGSDITPEDVADLMHEFGTTFLMTVFRLHNSERITARDRDRLRSEGAGLVNFIREAKGYDQEEIRAAPLPPEHMLKTLKMYEQGAIELPRLAQLLRMDEERATEYIARAERAGREIEPDLPAPASKVEDEPVDSLAAEIEEAFGEAEDK